MFSYLESLEFRSPTPEEAHSYVHALDCAHMHTPRLQQCTPSQTGLFMCLCFAVSRNLVQALPPCHLVY